MRKRTVAVLFAVALGVVVTGGLSFTTAAGISGMWKGIITDELCAKTAWRKQTMPYVRENAWPMVPSTRCTARQITKCTS